ncbi:hypothetical protein LTR35_017615 [Friedmanniomyces endolithicus]|uniref:Uncharacterized protein n=1 Tax=Friedmanniomyces endolithicus TaxID=329885 RepID=A0AAN6F5G3_9PEZI|nr:hypothetical protein LTR35_017615 [Friedmanniomyces endolithicus]KAK0268778.1 hypothetical protein LTS00_017476 [Friedmanniomyces endolithicus]KAK0302151.1 hypothetical protein LTR82_017976 [Friedmanniomyces endolithicus]KAK0972101.1 hypothetical protein LTR54_017648 [Friedmanniomyces endolithicus]
MSPRSEKPRLDPTERLLHRFYEPLVLLRILNAGRGAGEVELPPDTRSQTFDLRWRSFLDDLAWLADDMHGGPSVSAVAAQSLPRGNIFWLVTRSARSVEHLQRILAELKSVPDRPTPEIISVAEQLAKESITFSKDKIKHYARLLSINIRKARSTLQTEDGYEALLQGLGGLDNHYETHFELCDAARRFPHHGMLSRLIQSNSSIDTNSPWSTVRHYVGRLACWFNKCHRLVLTARQYPQLLENATVQFLALPTPSRLPCSDAKTNLESALRRMLPADQHHRLTAIYDGLKLLRTFFIEDAFAENLSDDKLKTAVHAEVFLMEHFYFNNFAFVGHERYIGCSKPSCYCCSLYTRYHPGNYLLRPAHNNAYVTWCPPLLSRLDQQKERKHNLDIMNQMNAYIRRDVMLEIEWRVLRRERNSDSTTGLGPISSQPEF